MKGQSEEIRTLAVAAHKAGQTPQMLAEIFQVTARTIYRWTKEAQAGQTAARKRGRRAYCLTAEDMRRLDALVRENPKKTLAKLREELNNPCSLPTIMRALVKLGHRDRKSAGIRRTKPPQGGVMPTAGPGTGSAPEFSHPAP
jgi:transposase